MTEKLIKTLVIKTGEDERTVTKCLELFEKRFKSDYKALKSGRTYPIGYFSEWCGRLKKNPMNYADNETKKVLKEIGY